MIRDVIEVTKLLTNIMKEKSTYSIIKINKTMEKKINPYHIDDILMRVLDNVIQSFIESISENQYGNDKESMNRTKEDTKSMEKDYFLKLQYSSL